MRDFIANSCGSDEDSDVMLCEYIRKARKMRYKGPAEDGILVEDDSDDD